MTPTTDTVFDAWADAYRIPNHARLDYYARLSARGPEHIPDPVEATSSEARAQSLVRLEAAKAGIYLWRNNIGMDTQTFVRYGLANDSPALNARLKSSDLIGIRPGGQFVCREIKHAGWRYTGTDREKAQLRFIELIRGLGGDAGFACGVGTL